MERKVWVLLLVAGCATGEGKSRFPSAEEIRKLAEAAPAKRLAAENVVDVERFTLGAPLPQAIALTPDVGESPWSGILRRAAEARRGLVQPSAELSCAAREIARFFVERKSLPSESLQDFMVTRCGASAVEIAAAWQSGDVPAGVGDEEVFARWREATERLVDKAIGGGSVTAGIAYARGEGRAAVLIVTARRYVDVEPVPLVPGAGGKVVLRGTLLAPGERLEALVNVGRFGVRRCTVDERVALPRFAVECESDPGDASTWLELAAFPPGRILGRIVWRAQLWPGGSPAADYQRASEEAAGAAAPAGELRRQLLAYINDARAAAKLGPLALADAESDVAARVAPHYFAALAGGEAETVADVVALGVRAGWDVGADVRYGQFTAGLVRAVDARALVRAALERPSAREALFDAGASRIAIGEVAQPDEKLLAAVFGVYALADGRDYAREAQRVLEELAAARRRAGKPAPLVVGTLNEAGADAAQVLGRGETPRQGLGLALARAADAASGRAVHAWALEYELPQGLRFPDELLNAPTVQLGIGVGGYRPPGAPWWHYVVFLIAADAPTTLAQRSPLLPGDLALLPQDDELDAAVLGPARRAVTPADRPRLAVAAGL